MVLCVTCHRSKLEENGFEKRRFQIPEYRNASSFLWRRGQSETDRQGEAEGWPIESWLKLAAVAIGILGELATGFDPTGVFVMHNGQV